MSTHDDIANAFERRFHHFGFRKTSVDDVARELKISKKTIYANFDSKDDIFRFLIGRASEGLMTSFSSGLADLPTARMRLEALIGMIFEQAIQFSIVRDPLDFQFKMAEEAFRKAYRSVLRGLLDDGKESGEFQSVERGVTVLLIDGLVAAGVEYAIPRASQKESTAEILAATISAALKIVS